MADFTTYKQIVLWLGKGKRRTEGRRKRSFMFRMIEGSDVVIMSRATRVWIKDEVGRLEAREWRLYDFAEIRPNDVLTFTRTPEEMRDIAASMSATFWSVLGLCWTREGKGRYSLFKYEEDKALYWQVRHRSTKKYDYFKNMMWDFNAGTCFNPRPPILKTVNRDSRKEWLADLKRFKRAFLTRAKLGIIDQIIADWEQSKAYSAWHLPVDDAVLNTIQSGEVTVAFIKQIVECRAATGWRPPLTRASVCNMLNTIINRNSIRYRQEYGVLRK